MVIVSASSFFKTNQTLLQWTIHAVVIAGIFSEVVTKLLPRPTIKMPALPVTSSPEEAP